MSVAKGIMIGLLVCVACIGGCVAISMACMTAGVLGLAEIEEAEQAEKKKLSQMTPEERRTYARKKNESGRLSLADIACKKQATAKLKAPSTATFGKLRATNGVTFRDTYVYSTWVDAQNSFGATIRSDVRCVFSIDDDGSLGLLKTIEIQ